MAQDPTFRGILPPKDGVDALKIELQSLRDEVRSLRTAQSGNAMTLTGNIKILGGSVEVYDTDGHLIGILGTGPTGRTGFEAARPDGTPSFAAVTSDGGFIGMYDRASNYIVTDDVTAAQGLARPYISIGTFTENTVPTVTTTSSTFTTLQSLVGYKQHPKVLMQVLVNAVSPGEVRVIDQDGNQIGSTVTFTAGQFQYVQIQGVLPGGHMLPVSLNLQARITSGSSPIGVRGVTAIGVESGAF